MIVPGSLVAIRWVEWGRILLRSDISFSYWVPVGMLSNQDVGTVVALQHGWVLIACSGGLGWIAARDLRTV